MLSLKAPQNVVTVIPKIPDMVFEEGPIKKGQLFVRGLTPSSNEKTLELAFSKFGPIEESE